MTSLNVQAAQERILAHFQPVETENLPLERCAGRVLAVAILSSDLPLFDNSSMDGFALIAADLAQASPASPRLLRVVADIAAGFPSDVVLSSGEAARIMTGAPIPKGATAVIMAEDTDFDERAAGVPLPDRVKVFKSVPAGENIRPRGMDIQSGQQVLVTGQRLRAQDVGMLAMLSVANVPVFRRPRVALLSSGDELLPVDRPLSPGKIRDSNSYVLAAQIAGAGCEVLPLGIAPDSREAIQLLLDQAVGMHADAIVTTAGVSIGAFDFTKEAVESNGRLDFWKVNMRPGKPLAFGEYRGVPFFGLPGNPVSAFVGFEVFVLSALARLAGLQMVPRPRVRVRLSEPIVSDGRESYLRAIVEEREGVWFAKLTGHQGSGNLLSLVQANALLIVPAGVKSLAIDALADAWWL